MRTLLTILAAAAIVVGCTNPQTIDLTETETETEVAQNHLFFDDKEGDIINTLYGYALELYQVNIELEVFQEALPISLRERLGEQCYPDLNDLIEAIYIWVNDECGDVLVEYPTYDDFIEAVAHTKWAKFFI